jgi:DNA-binding NtrC family response regulator
MMATQDGPVWEEPTLETSHAEPARADAAGAPAGDVNGLTDSTGHVLKLDELEKNAIKVALKQTSGNRTQAAAALGISIRTLRNKLQEYREAGDPIDVGMESADA